MGADVNQNTVGKTAYAATFVVLAACSAEETAPPDAGDIGFAVSDEVPLYEVDAGWPGPLPSNWILGQVSGIAVDRRDHVWIVHRPRSLTAHEMAAVQNPPTADCCAPAPSVIEFDADGRFVQAWGGPSWDQASSSWMDPDDDWPQQEHGIFVDAEDNVWLAGNGADDHIVLKMRPDGTRLLTIGRVGETGGSNDSERLGRPADIAVNTGTREVFVADGYGNRRVIVFNMDNGAYKRHWGAYGNVPSDDALPAYRPGAEPARDFLGPVHSVIVSGDGRLYVADRSANRIQVFEPDGKFVAEAVLAAWTLDQGSAWDIAGSAFAGDRWLFVADGHNKKVWILDRESLETLGSFGRGGRQAGQFEWVHNIAVDSRGNLYTAEVNTGKRVQKFYAVATE